MILFSLIKIEKTLKDVLRCTLTPFDIWSVTKSATNNLVSLQFQNLCKDFSKKELICGLKKVVVSKFCPLLVE